MSCIRHAWCLRAAAALSALLPMACDVPSQPRRGGETEPSRATYSNEERRAAQALSLGNDPTLTTESSPYQRALICSDALAALNRRFRTSAQMTSSVQTSMLQVEVLFDRQLERLGREQNKSTEEVASDRAQQAARGTDDGAKARIALGCIRELQNGA